MGKSGAVSWPVTSALCLTILDRQNVFGLLSSYYKDVFLFQKVPLLEGKRAALNWVNYPLLGHMRRT
jgi:hypothetical protein